MDTKINDAIKSVLQQFGDKYFIEGILNKNKVIQDLDGYDRDLLEAFVSDEVLRSHFTMDVAGNIVIQTNKLIDLFEADEYWKDSYTRYSKKIGLTAGGIFIDEATDVVLDFPYKDTVLKANMSKEDIDKNDLRPDEPFLNEVIAKEEIDTLLDKKILVNAKRFDVNGKHEINSFNEDDNLIMKGNNLLALHTLKDKYAGKVKLIYIDPPYNTGNDGFNYNDKFTHASWLTFMKNRLEIALELLTYDGSLWINIDDGEVHYLKVLCDQIFKRENFIANIVWQKKYTISNDARYFSDNHDHILVYARDKQNININGLPRSEAMNSRYKNVDDDPNGPWMTQPLHAKSGTERNFIHTFSNGITWSPPRGTFPRYTKEKLKELDDKGGIWFGKDGTAVPRAKKYLANMGDVTPGTFWQHQDFGNNDQANKEVRALIDDREFATPKPEKLLQQLMTIGSNEKDLILDFFMGSSTTQAVAHKMNRRYIGIEQMDYINTVSIPRLQKVIEGEQGGISKDVQWDGGGSFVYVELMEKNRGFLKTIQDTETQTDLDGVFKFMLEEAEIDFRVNLEAVKDTFHDLSLDDQKKILIKIIDKNQLYYNYSEIDDENVRDLISDEDYAFNQSFYEGERE